MLSSNTHDDAVTFSPQNSTTEYQNVEEVYKVKSKAWNPLKAFHLYWMRKVVTKIWQSIWKLYCCKINKSSLWLHTSTKVGNPLRTLHEPTLCIQINLYFHKRCYLLIFIIKTVFCSCDVVKHPVLFSCNGKWFKTFWIQVAMHIFL